ncbi:MAG TPA: hypothetical protein VHC67_01995 [Gaiellaceae bacterium]|jgi:hypothetical protein|nr:hypothetical protein [Gaiellaceae bacterium]
MAEPLPEPTPPRSFVDPAEHEAEMARRNIQWGWALFALFWVLFGGTVGIAYIYLWLS